MRHKDTISLVLGFLALTILAGVMGVRGVTQTVSQAAQMAEVTMFMHPSRVNVLPGEQFELMLKVDTGTTVISGVKGAVVYDPVFLTVKDVEVQESIFSTLKTGKTETAVHFLATEKIIGNGTVLKVMFTANRSGMTQISFTDETKPALPNPVTVTIN